MGGLLAAAAAGAAEGHRVGGIGLELGVGSTSWGSALTWAVNVIEERLLLSGRGPEWCWW